MTKDDSLATSAFEYGLEGLLEAGIERRKLESEVLFGLLIHPGVGRVSPGG